MPSYPNGRGSRLRNGQCAGSNPAGGTFRSHPLGAIGRRGGLKSRCPMGIAGSTPAGGIGQDRGGGASAEFLQSQGVCSLLDPRPLNSAKAAVPQLAEGPARGAGGCRFESCRWYLLRPLRTRGARDALGQFLGRDSPRDRVGLTLDFKGL